MNFDDALSGASLPERTERVCLNSALLDEYDRARVLAETAESGSRARGENGSETMAQRGQVKKLTKAADDLRQRVEAEAVELRFRALPFAAYNALVVKHPPRKDVAVDKQWGFNVAEFYPALIRSCLVDPVVTDEQWSRFLDVLNDQTFTRLSYVVHELNRQKDINVPF